MEHRVHRSLPPRIGLLVAAGWLLAVSGLAQSVPTVTSVTRTSASTLTVGSKASYTLTIKAGASPVSSVNLALQDAAGGHHSIFTSSVALAAGATGSLTLETTVGHTWLNGAYRILFLTVADTANRQIIYRDSGLVETQPAADSAALTPHALGFASATFLVTGGQPTLQMPRLNGLTRTSAAVVRAGDVLDFRPAVTAGNRGLQQGVLQLLDPGGNTRWIGYSSSLVADPAQTQIDSTWAKGTYRVHSFSLTDEDFRTVQYSRSGATQYFPEEAGATGTHPLAFASLDFEVAEGVDVLAPSAVVSVTRVSPALLYPGDTAILEIAVQPGTTRLSAVTFAVLDPAGLSRSAAQFNPVFDASHRLRLSLPLEAAWPRGRYLIQSVQLVPESGWSRTYLRSGYLESVRNEPLVSHTLNLPSLDFDYEDRPAPPAITDFPSGVRSLVLGASPIFTVTATGRGPLTYQWRKDGQPLVGAVTPTLTLTDFRTSQAGVYDVVVSNPGGSVTALPALTLLVANPAITRQPWSALAPEGNAVDLSVAASGASLDYQWYEGLAGDRSYPLADSNRAGVRVPPSLQTRSFWVRITNFAGLVSSEAVLVPPQTMLVSRQPAAWTTVSGNLGLFSFRVKVLGETGPLSVRVWKGTSDVTSRFLEIERTAAPVIENLRTYTEIEFKLQVGPVGAADAGLYRFEVLIGGVAQPLLVSQPTSLVLTTTGVPRVLADPASQRVRRGDTATLSVQAVASGALSYQWRRNRIQIPGATQATLTLAGAGELTAGDYDVIVSTATGAVVSSAATVTLATDFARLTNLSVRGVVLGRSRPLIAGLVIRDPLSQGLPLVVRGVGPTLGQFGISSAMRDPEVLTFSPAGVTLAENNDWGGGATLTTAFARVGAFAYFEPASRDAALLQTPGAGALTVHLQNRVEETGSGLIEVYDDSGPPSWENERAPRLINLSTRVQLVTGQTLIAGFAVSGNRPLRLLVRAAGPALRKFGLTQVMDDPRLTVYRADGTVLATNDDWELGPGSAEVAAAARTTGAFAFDPASRDAALLLDLPPGTATVHLTGSSGEALIELYVVE